MASRLRCPPERELVLVFWQASRPQRVMASSTSCSLLDPLREGMRSWRLMVRASLTVSSGSRQSSCMT
uniref:Uncharacterized protein n=1 Tax=Ixodes ricinus TaxID=34613 RepID=A0A6B0TWM4_IXORI